MQMYGVVGCVLDRAIRWISLLECDLSMTMRPPHPRHVCAWLGLLSKPTKPRHELQRTFLQLLPRNTDLTPVSPLTIIRMVG